MSTIRRLTILMLVAAVSSLGTIGCRCCDKPRHDEHPTAEHPKKEHPQH